MKTIAEMIKKSPIKLQTYISNLEKTIDEKNLYNNVFNRALENTNVFLEDGFRNDFPLPKDSTIRIKEDKKNKLSGIFIAPYSTEYIEVYSNNSLLIKPVANNKVLIKEIDISLAGEVV